MLSVKIALRELRHGFRGFRIFLACLALGVAAIAAVGSLSEAFQRGLSEEARALLGGDVEVEIIQRPATDAERAFFAESGAVSEMAALRAMARREDGAARRLVSLKAVDTAYPLFGMVESEPQAPIQDHLGQRGGLWGAVAEDTLLRRLDLGLGDRLVVGTLSFEIRAVVTREPDSISGGFRLGPRLMIARDALAETGLETLGSLIEYHYRIALGGPLGTDSDSAVEAWIDEARAAFPEEAWQIRDRMNAAANNQQLVRQVSVFLTLVGLTALVVGGVGVGNAVKSYLDRKRGVIATFKCLGAEGGLIFRAYLVQAMAIALVGIAIGLAIGAATPFLVAGFFGEILPIPARFGVYPDALWLAALYGLLVALAFTVWPLARAREVPAASLFRDLIAPVRRWPRAPYMVLLIVSFAVLAALAILFTENRIFSAVFLVGTGVVFAILWAAAGLLMRISRRMGRPRAASLRLAIANLHRPGAPTPSVVLSLGLGLTLLVTIALIDGNISAQVRDRLPEGAPAFFFVDIQKDQADQFDALAAGVEGVSAINRVANLRGRITAIKGVPAEEAEVAEGGRWALRGDRGITYSALLPENSEVIEGAWWPRDYAGPPLLSMDEELAGEFGVTIGDTITFNILGRTFETEIASLRRLDWETVGINFNFVVSPGLLEGAPHTFVATVAALPEAEDELERVITDAFPNVSAVRVREALESINAIVSDLALAVRGTSAVTLIAGILVLAGAMAAGHRQRVYDAAVLKVLGATRARVMAGFALEYAVLGTVTALIAVGAGTLAAWLVVTEVMEAPWRFLPGTVLATVVGSAIVTVILGLMGTWRVLGRKAAPILRSP